MSSSSFETSLFVRDRNRHYQPATQDQILEAARQVADLRMQRGALFSSPLEVRGFFRDKLAGLDREVFAVAFLDTRHRLIDYAELFFGTVDGAEVHPRIVAREALLHNAAALVIAHNHPSGNPEPSAADRALTSHLKQALALVEVRLLDHIIVGGAETVALAERGWV